MKELKPSPKLKNYVNLRHTKLPSCPHRDGRSITRQRRPSNLKDFRRGKGTSVWAGDQKNSGMTLDGSMWYTVYIYIHTLYIMYVYIYITANVDQSISYETVLFFKVYFVHSEKYV